jgi:hypothetical protein
LASSCVVGCSQAGVGSCRRVTIWV